MSISQHLQPIANAIAGQTGGDVYIFVVGPIPARKGQIEARSISASRPGGTGSSWVDSDPIGVKETQRRLVDYARGNFSKWSISTFRSTSTNL